MAMLLDSSTLLAVTFWGSQNFAICKTYSAPNPMFYIHTYIVEKAFCLKICKN